MKTARLVALFITAFFSPGLTSAYEKVVHEYLSAEALETSRLAGGIWGSVLEDIGAASFFAQIYTSSTDESGLSITQLMQLGANLEDEPWQKTLTHFFNPQYNNFEGTPFRFLGIKPPGLYTSPDWVIEGDGENNSWLVPQEFSYRDAKRYFKYAMTGSTETLRLANIALMFETLGHVIHHIQDMAQPQHTRSDAHVPDDYEEAQWFIEAFGQQPKRASLYEKFTAAEIYSQEKLRSVLSHSPFNFYMQTPKYPTIRHFWHTPGAATDIRSGMAEFSSLNYVADGSLFVSDWPMLDSFRSQSQLVVPFPDGNNVSIIPRTVIAEYADETTVSEKIDFIVGDVRDDYNNIEYSSRELATTSLLSRPSQIYTSERVVSINREVFLGMHDVLLPRAVAYSRGIINHFFRGKLDVARVPDERNLWEITNRSSETMNGAFTLLFESNDSNGTRSQYAAALETLAPNQSMTLSAPEPPEESTSKVIAVFEGELGAEQNFPGGIAAAKVVDFTTPPDPPIPCGSPLTASGSSEGFAGVYELGSTSGTVPVEFEAYTIPDALQINKYGGGGNATLIDTNGLVSGRHNFPFEYDAQSFGTTQVSVTVTGNSDPNTQWWIVVGCPGESSNVNPNDRPQPVRTVIWRFTKETPSAPSCSFDLYIDGQFSALVGSGSRLFVRELSAGPHHLTYENKTCYAGAGNNFDYSASYEDADTRHYVTSPIFNSGDPIYFEVH